MQESGHVGRDGLPAIAILYYEKSDLIKVKGVSEGMKMLKNVGSICCSVILIKV